jgi:hypothetical protein
VVLLVAFFFALAPLALSSLCFAEEGDSIGPRLGIAVGGVMGLAGNWPGGDDPLTFGRGRPAGMVGPQVDAAALNPTLQLDLGVRFNRHVGAFIRKRRSRQLFRCAATWATRVVAPSVRVRPKAGRVRGRYPSRVRWYSTRLEYHFEYHFWVPCFNGGIVRVTPTMARRNSLPRSSVKAVDEAT